jgi:hypothetical protein
VPSYFETFGAVPTFSDAWRRVQERGITQVALRAALATEPRLGTTKGTVIYGARDVEVVVELTSGGIVTLWWTP